MSPVSDVEGATITRQDTDVDEETEADRPWVVIVWNDPINLMSYVTWVFQKLFGYPRPKAEKLMMDVHNLGKAVVSVELGFLARSTRNDRFAEVMNVHHQLLSLCRT